MNFIQNVLFICFLGLPTISLAGESLSVQLLSERYRTESNGVEYRISLTNKSVSAILDPEVRYFAENSFIQYCENRMNDTNCFATRYGSYAEDSLLTAWVDHVSSDFSVDPVIFPNGKYTEIRLKLAGLFYPGKTVQIHLGISKKDSSSWDSSRDWSYQKNAEVIEPNYFMAVYDASRNILWGDDPNSGKHNSDVVTWSERGKNSTVGPFDGDTSAMVPAGRFWMLKDIPLSSKERGLLVGIGINRLDAGRHQGKSLLLFKADASVRKTVLDSLVATFYNAFPADDTTKIGSGIILSDFGCDSNGNCQKQESPSTEFDMEVGCWPDVSMDACKTSVKQCGGVNAVIDRRLVLSTHSMASISCLESNKDINHLIPQREGEPDKIFATRKISKVQERISVPYQINGAPAKLGSIGVAIQNGQPRLNLKK
ncbi:MAG: hypothetical protein M0P13_01550 [Fibrobacteraceae bacterium]|nr:hypothetical protein [Fibrobacteraceae bacterium]